MNLLIESRKSNLATMTHYRRSLLLSAMPTISSFWLTLTVCKFKLYREHPDPKGFQIHRQPPYQPRCEACESRTRYWEGETARYACFSYVMLLILILAVSIYFYPRNISWHRRHVHKAHCGRACYRCWHNHRCYAFYQRNWHFQSHWKRPFALPRGCRDSRIVWGPTVYEVFKTRVSP